MASPYSEDRPALRTPDLAVRLFKYVPILENVVLDRIWGGGAAGVLYRQSCF